MRRTLTTFLAALALTTTAACGGAGDGAPVSQADFEEQGQKWPLAIDEGTVHADDGAIYFRDPDGTTYALNGPAQQDHEDIEPIHLEDEEIADAFEGSDAEMPRVSLAPLIDAAQ